MKRQTIRQTLAASLLALSCAYPFTSTGAESSDPHAEAGLMMWSFAYHDVEVPVALWYPSSAQAQAIPAGPFTLHAASNGEWLSAPKPSERFPLLVISHGTGGSSIAHHRIAESLATAGYLVAALEHPGDNYRDRSLVANEAYFDERPRQLQALLSALATDPELGPRIDPVRVGAIGHSAGGYSVAALLGAKPDRDALIEHCNTVTDDPSCGYADPAIGVTAATTTPFEMPNEHHTQVTSAGFSIRSAALLAPLGSVASGTSHINPEIEVLIMDAEKDAILPAHYHAEKLQGIAPHAQRMTAEGAGHFSFISPVTAAWQSELGEVAEDPTGFDRSAFNFQAGKTLQVWFDSTLN